MLYFIYESYNDKKGTGEIEAFNTVEQALQFAKEEGFLHLCEKDKDDYRKSPYAFAHIYTVELTADEYEAWNNCEEDFYLADKEVFDGFYCDFLDEEQVANITSF